MAKQNKGTPERKKRQPARIPKLESLGKYQIQKQIGAGGMGAVFLAHDTRLNRLAALKVLPRDKAENPVLVKRFKAEGQAAAHLRHENIVSVYDAGEEDGYLYIALEYIDGIDLHELISKKKRIAVPRSLEIITQVTRALAHAYEQGIVHRDIKPANILIRHDGVVKLTDLGLARSIDDNTETNITRAGTTVGTVDYMAPEQARDSKAADIRSDLYSLGCTWYHMLTGRAPFSEGSLTNKLAAHASKPPPDPRELNDRVPEGMVAIMQRMMAKLQKDRYQTPGNLLEDLKNSNLKRSNVDNNVLEALANDESDSEQETPESNLKQAADSSDFLINQFMPDYSSTTDENEDDSVDHISTSFDLQKLADGLETSAESEEPENRQRKKPVRRSIEPEPVSKKRGKQSKTRREEPEPEEGSVISDSAMKTRQTADSRKRGTSDKRKKKRKPVSETKKRSQKGTTEPDLPQKSSRKKTQHASSSEKQISVDYKRIAMLIGGVILLILLILLGMKSFNSSDQNQPGSGNNPFATEEQNQQLFENQSLIEGESQPPEETGNSPQTVELTDSETQREKSPTEPKNLSNTTSKNITVRGQEQRLLPQWGPGFLPLTDSKDVNPYPDLPVFKVVRNKTKDGIFRSLDEAIKAVPSKGAVIRLLGQGPFLLNPHRIQNIPHLIIMADSQQNPVVVIQAKGSKPQQFETDLFTISAGEIRFKGIHFLFDASQLPGSGTCNIFSIDQSDLTFQNSSFSLTGKNQTNIRLINSTGDPRTTTARPQGESRILLENSVITGENLESVRVNQAYADVLISNCYISSNGAPCLEATGLGLIKKNSSLLEERRIPFSARIFSSTLLSDRSIIEMNGPTEKKEKKQAGQSESKSTLPPQTEIIVVNSVLIGNPDQKNSSMLSLINWPLDQLRKESKSRFKGLNFQLESSLLWGWPHYVSASESDTSQNTFQIDSHRTWQQSWGIIVAAHAFNPQIPSELNELRAPALIKPLLDFSRQKAVYAISEGGVIAGCDPAALNSISPGQLDRVNATLEKPQIAKQIKDIFAKAKTVTFDMTNRDLAEFLNSAAISGPTNVIVSGQGICYTMPILIQKKQVRLQFQKKTDTNPFIIQLKLSSAAVKKRPRNLKSPAIPSFITLNNSTLELTGGHFRIPAERKGVIPRHFLHSQNSLVALKRCEINAMLINNKRFQSVAYAGSGKMNQVLIDSSYLATSGTIFESHASKLNIDIQNSLLLSQSNLFAFENQNSEPSSIKVTLHQNTLVSRESFFTFQENDDKTKTGKTSVQIFADESLFIPAPSTPAMRSNLQTVSLFSMPQKLRDNKNVKWWGNSNGFMVEKLNLLAEKGSASQTGNSNGFLKGMEEMFGTEANQHTLALRGGIILQEQKLPPLVKIKPTHFRLLPTCKAANWSELKQPIGVNLSEWEKIQKGSPGPDKSGRIKRAF